MLRFAQIVTIFALAAQAIGFLRTAIIAYMLGVSLSVDAYNLALVAPTLFATVFSSVLQSAFVGRYAGFVGAGQTEAAAAYRTRMLLTVILVGVAGAALGTMFPRQILAWSLPQSQDAMLNAATAALQWSAWNMLFLVVADFIGLILNSHRKFAAAAAAPLVNAVVSVGALWFWPHPDLEALVVTLLAGSLAQLVFISAALWAMRLPVRLSASARGEIRQTFYVALPIFPAMFLSNAGAAIVQFRMAGIGEGALSVFGYASRIHNALCQILVLGIGTVLLPHVAQLWARSEIDDIRRLYRRLVRVTILLTGALTVGIALMGTDTIALLLGRGRMQPEYVAQVGTMWFVLTLALLPMTIGTFIAKLAQARRSSLAILATGAISFSAVWVVSDIGAARQDMYLVGLSVAVGFLGTMAFWFVWISRGDTGISLVGDGFGALWRSVIVLAPPAAADLFVADRLDLAPLFADLAVRCAIFGTIAAVTLIGTGLHGWFLGNDLMPEPETKG